MPKRSPKSAKTRSPHDDYELPAELDFSKLKFIGFGLDALERHEARQSTTVTLDSDVAKVFGTSEAVNIVLRGIIQSLSAATKRKKTA